MTCRWPPTAPWPAGGRALSDKCFCLRAPAGCGRVGAANRKRNGEMITAPARPTAANKGRRANLRPRLLLSCLRLAVHCLLQLFFLALERLSRQFTCHLFSRFPHNYPPLPTHTIIELQSVPLATTGVRLLETLFFFGWI